MSVTTQLNVRSECPATYIAANLSADDVVNVRFLLEAVTGEAGGRLPLELVLVLDTSGSMAGDKLQHLQNSVVGLIQRLIPEDVVHVIEYNSQPNIIAEQKTTADTSDLVRRVWALEARGTTDISLGLKEAARIFQRHGTAEAARQLHRHIFLYTDGQPTDGLKTSEELSSLVSEIATSSNLSVCTFGIGNDVDGPLLEEMADHGGGMYNFVTPRRIDEMTRLALQGLARVIGTRGKVVIELDSGIYPTPPTAGDILGTSIEITIGDVRANNRRTIPLALRASRGLILTLKEKPEGETVKLGSATFSYQPVVNPLEYSSLTVPICTTVVHAALPPGSDDSKVVVAFALAEMARIEEHTGRLIAEGTSEGRAAAIRSLREGVAMLAAVQSRDDSEFVETAMRRATRTLQRLSVGGADETARVQLELHMQANVFGRQSPIGFTRSESGNISEVEVQQPFALSQDRPWRSPRRRNGSDTHSSGSDEDPDIGSLVMPSAAPTLLGPITLPPGLVSAAEQDKAPNEFLCPITRQLMTNPVFTSDGFTYELSAIEAWFRDGNITSPATGLALSDTTLRPNLALRSMISNWAA